MVRSNQDAGHSPLFNTTVGAIGGAGLGALAVGGGNALSSHLGDKHAEALMQRSEAPMARVNQKLADGVITPSQAARHTSRLERSYNKAFDSGIVGKFSKGMNALHDGATKLKMPGGALGAAAVIGGLTGAIAGRMKND